MVIIWGLFCGNVAFGMLPSYPNPDLLSLAAIKQQMLIADPVQPQKPIFLLPKLTPFKFAKNVDQTTIIRNLSLYAQQKGDVNMDQKLKDSGGYCGGFANLWVYIKWLQTHSLQQYSADTVEWFESTIILLADLKYTNKTLKPFQIKNIDRLVYLLELFQSPSQYFQDIQQSDIDKMIHKATGGKTLQLEYLFSSGLNLNQLKEVLNTENFIQDNRFIRLSVNKHVFVLFKYDKDYYFYDSNSTGGEYTTKSIDELAEWIFAGLYKIGTGVGSSAPFRFKIFASPGEEGFVTRSYPQQQVILQKIKALPLGSDLADSVRQAIYNGDLGSLKYFLALYSSEEQKTLIRKNDWATLITAASLGYTDIVEEFLKILGAEFDPKAVSSCQVLMVAAEKGHCDIVKNLLSRGVDPRTALKLAAKGGHVSVIDVLFNQKTGKPQQKPEIWKIKEALTIAAQHNHVPMVQRLFAELSHPMDIKDMYGIVFMHAVQNNNLGLVVWLMDKGVDPTQVGLLRNRTALMVAAESGHTQIIKKLLACKKVASSHTYLNAILPDTYDNALMLALKQKHTDIVREFITVKQAGLEIDFNQASADGYTALMLAVQQNDDEIVEEMLKITDIKFDQVSIDGDTALTLAAKEDNIDMVLALLDTGLKVDPKAPKSYMAALILAIQNNRLDIVMALINQGINLDQPLPISKTENINILELAVTNNCFDIVQELLERDVNPNVITQDGITILAVAAENGYYKIVQLLLDNGNIQLDHHSAQEALELAKAAAAEKENSDKAKAYRKIIELLTKFQ